MKTFDEYKMIHNYMHPGEPLKSWLNQESFFNTYLLDWNALINVITKISNKKHWTLSATIEWLSDTYTVDGIDNIKEMYETVVDYLKENQP